MRSVSANGLAILTLVLGIGAAPVNAAIVKVQGEKSCSVTGLDDATSIQGGVHCASGDVGFSLTAVLDGSIGLLVGDSKTPSWNILNDTGAAVTSLSIYYSGNLASNSFIDMQESGGIFTEFSWSDAATNGSATDGKTIKPEDGLTLPVLLTWSGGTGLGIGETFNLGTSSFASAGQDAGCLSGTADCSPAVIPIPAAAWLFASALGVLGYLGKRKAKA